MRYSNDPFSIKAKFNSKCSCCGSEIKKGDQCYFYPRGHKVECWSCSQTTRELMADERVNDMTHMGF